MQLIELESAIEAILFASGEPVSVNDISKALEQDFDITEKLINNLKIKYTSEKRGINIITLEDKVQMCTSANYFTYIQKLLKTAPRKSLTPSMLETLAIIAYKQPVTKNDIENIRGVNPDHAVNKLMEYNLIEEKGRLDAPGKPILFGTTNAFLSHFGLSSINNLPQLADISEGSEEITIDNIINNNQ